MREFLANVNWGLVGGVLLLLSLTRVEFSFGITYEPLAKIVMSLYQMSHFSGIIGQ